MDQGISKRKNNSIHQIIEAPISNHSKKPEEVRRRIIDLMGDIPRIELFARDNGNKDLWNKNRLEGWDVWGNEVESDITI